MKTCCEGDRSEVVQAAICYAQLQGQGDLPRRSALTDLITALDDNPSIEQHVVLGQAQALDAMISRVVHLIKTGKHPSIKKVKVNQETFSVYIA